MSGGVKLLVLGAGGQLGQTVLELAALKGVAALGAKRSEIDITDEAAIGAAIRHVQPTVILNAAAYTAVDKAEANEAEAVAGNVEGPAAIARAARASGLPVIHISTDYVFDGSQPGARVESDPVAPIGVYGRTKAEGEERVRAENPAHLILRTAWVYGPYGSNFLKTMLRLAGERDELRVVADQTGNPTATVDIAEAVLAAAAHLERGGKGYGTYHFAGDGITSWHGFASEIVALAAPITGRKPVVTAIATAESPTPARRPANSALDSTLFATTFGYRAAPWRRRTAETVNRLLSHDKA